MGAPDEITLDPHDGVQILPRHMVERGVEEGAEHRQPRRLLGRPVARPPVPHLDEEGAPTRIGLPHPGLVDERLAGVVPGIPFTGEEGERRAEGFLERTELAMEALELHAGRVSKRADHAETHHPS